jgi:hypothetical protein
VATAAEVQAKGSCKIVKVRMSLVLECLARTPCGSATGWGGRIMFLSHVASLGVDAMVSVSVRALGCVSMSRIHTRI